MSNNSAVTDIGLVSPDWLQDDIESPELDALPCCCLKSNYCFYW